METPDGGTPRRGELETANTHTVTHLPPDDKQRRMAASSKHTLPNHTHQAERQPAPSDDQNDLMKRADAPATHDPWNSAESPDCTGERFKVRKSISDRMPEQKPPPSRLNPHHQQGRAMPRDTRRRRDVLSRG